jgi:hypothetical protein
MVVAGIFSVNPHGGTRQEIIASSPDKAQDYVKSQIPCYNRSAVGPLGTSFSCGILGIAIGSLSFIRCN